MIDTIKQTNEMVIWANKITPIDISDMMTKRSVFVYCWLYNLRLPIFNYKKDFEFKEFINDYDGNKIKL